MTIEHNMAEEAVPKQQADEETIREAEAIRSCREYVAGSCR